MNILCQKCGTGKNVRCRKKFAGELLCDGCFKKDPRNFENCSKCGEFKPVNMRDELRRPICPGCYKKIRYADKKLYEVCAGCDNVKPVHVRDGNRNALCVSCYRRLEQPEIECADCGKTRRAGGRRPDGAQICCRCSAKSDYENPKKHAICFHCQEKKPVWKRLASGGSVCMRCYQRFYAPKRKCYECGRKRRIVNRGKDRKRPLCAACNTKRLRRAKQRNHSTIVCS